MIGTGGLLPSHPPLGAFHWDFESSRSLIASHLGTVNSSLVGDSLCSVRNLLKNYMNSHIIVVHGDWSIQF